MFSFLFRCLVSAFILAFIRQPDLVATKNYARPPLSIRSGGVICVRHKTDLFDTPYITSRQSFLYVLSDSVTYPVTGLFRLCSHLQIFLSNIPLKALESVHHYLLWAPDYVPNLVLPFCEFRSPALQRSMRGQS